MRNFLHVPMIIVVILLATTYAQRPSTMSLKQCASGRKMSCMIAPCRSRMCAAFPDAECRNNYCDECSAEFWVGNTEVTSQCDQANPSAVKAQDDIMPEGFDCSNMACLVNPCQTAKCPNRPTATCRTDSNCKCQATFWEGLNEVTSQCQTVTNNKQVVQTLGKAGSPSMKPCQSSARVTCQMSPCSTSSCPKHPNAQCRNNYCGDCSAEYWVGLREVTKECIDPEPNVIKHGSPSLKLCMNRPRTFCQVTPCSTASCPKYPNAQCRNNYCGECKPEFWVGLREVTSDCAVEKTVKNGGSPSLKLCMNRPRTFCQVVPCSTASCPKHPNAQCRNNYCGECKPEFWVGLREVTSDCAVEKTVKNVGMPSRKPCANQAQVQCQMAPCATRACSRYPDAQCRNNYCGSCDVEFWVGNREVTSECSTDELSLSQDRNVSDVLTRQTGNTQNAPAKACPNRCLFSPCLFSFCASFPQAQCRYDSCKGCTAQFWMGQEDVTARCNESTPSLRRLSGLFSRFSQPRRRNFLTPWYALLNGLFK